MRFSGAVHGFASELNWWYNAVSVKTERLLTRLTGMWSRHKSVPLSELAGVVNVPRCTLRRAALDGRLDARKVGGVWHSTQAAVEYAWDHRDIVSGRTRREGS